MSATISGQDYVSIDSLNRITQQYYDSHGNVTEIVYPDLLHGELYL